jgi:CMP-N-acetylneuraminic acid synthetase
MINYKRKIIALIPARGGSQEIKKKNMLRIKGKPLIYYTIREAKKCKLIDEIYVSSENKKILKYSESQKVQTITRPKNFSLKNSHPKLLVFHFISFLKKNGYQLNDIIIYLQPTSPLRKKNDITKAIMIMKKTNNYNCLSVAENKKTIFKSLYLKNKTLRCVFNKKYLNFRRQNLKKTYYINGAIFAFSIKDFIKNKNFPSNNSNAYVMNEKNSLDLDTKDDLKKLKKIIK